MLRLDEEGEVNQDVTIHLNTREHLGFGTCFMQYVENMSDLVADQPDYALAASNGSETPQKMRLNSLTRASPDGTGWSTASVDTTFSLHGIAGPQPFLPPVKPALPTRQDLVLLLHLLLSLLLPARRDTPKFCAPSSFACRARSACSLLVRPSFPCPLLRSEAPDIVLSLTPSSCLAPPVDPSDP